jgi:biopolymer transport protein ExbD
MSMIRASSADTSVLSEINITPFTDVLLVLLIIFMILASLALPPGFERRFPCGCSIRTPQHPPRQIAIAVTRAGRIYVEGTATSIAALYPLLTHMHARAPRDTVSLYADAAAPYGVVIRVIDAAKAGGIDDVTFSTQ